MDKIYEIHTKKNWEKAFKLLMPNHDEKKFVSDLKEKMLDGIIRIFGLYENNSLRYLAVCFSKPSKFETSVIYSLKGESDLLVFGLIINEKNGDEDVFSAFLQKLREFGKKNSLNFKLAQKLIGRNQRSYKSDPTEIYDRNARLIFDWAGVPKKI